MNKEKFIKFLRQELDVLKDSEIDEIIAEYSQHIDMKVEAGASEEEAIADFGDLDDFVAEILDAYKVDYNEARREHIREQRFEDFGETIKRGLNKALDFVTRIANGIMASSGREIISMVIEFVIVIFLMVLVNGGISFVIDLLKGLFYFRPFFITNFIRMILDIASGLIRVFISLLIMYWFFKERVVEQLPTDNIRKQNEAYFKGYDRKYKGSKSMNNYEDGDNDSHTQTDENSEINLNDNEEKDDDDVNTYYENRNVYSKRTKTSDSKFWKTVKSFIFWCIKIIGYMILIPLVVLVALGIVSALWFLVMTFKGVGSWGILMIGIGSLILFGSIIFGALGWLSGSDIK